MNCKSYQAYDDKTIGPLGIDYGDIYYCQSPDYHVILVIVLILWIAFLMNLLASTAENYFSPTLGFICDKLDLAYDIAGVTFLALGNGAPDFFSLLASFSGDANVLVSLGGLLGGSVFICTVVVGSIALCSPCEVSQWIFLRDVFFHIIATTSVLILVFVGSVNLVFAIAFLLVYLFYVALVSFASYFNKKQPITRDSTAGDIPLHTLNNNNNEIQFAVWHRNSTPTTTNNTLLFTSNLPNSTKYSLNTKASSNSNKPEKSTTKPASTGYSFLILDENDDEENATDANGNSSNNNSNNNVEKDGVINLSGGFMPEFDDIIKEDFYQPPAVDDTLPAFQEQEYTSASACESDDEYDQVIQFNSIADTDTFNPLTNTHNHHSNTKDNSNATAGTNTFERTNSLTSNLKQSLLNNSLNGNPLSRSSKVRLQSRGAYQNILSSLYWKRWSLERKFKKHVVLADWWNAPVYLKLYFFIDYPTVVLRDLTIPTLDTANWNKNVALLQPYCSSLFLIWLFGYLNASVAAVPVPVISLLVSIAPTFLIFALTHQSRPPDDKVFAIIWCLYAFSMCIFWTYMVASELIITLTAAGLFMQLPPSFLGLTILAWGNSVGDFFTNLSVAKSGFGEMAIAGCYAGPVFNILVGLGTSLCYGCFEAFPRNLAVDLDRSSVMSVVFLYIALVSTAMIVSLQKFHLTRSFGIYLISLYVVYTLAQALLLVI